jgi:hypothetical protein
MKRLLVLLLLLFFPVATRATVTSQTTSVSFTCTGSTGPYSFTFPISDPTAMTVVQNGTILATTAYTIAPVNNDYHNGGNITLNVSCPNGQSLVLQRKTPLTQATVFVDNMPSPMASVGNAADKLTEIAQEGTSLINGASIPTSTPIVGTNSLGQIVAASGSIASGSIGNGTTVIDATTMTGSDAGAKINAAIAQICASYPGGEVHAEGFGNTGTFAENITVGATNGSCSIKLDLPAGNFSTSNGSQIVLVNNSRIEGVTGPSGNAAGSSHIVSSGAASIANPVIALGVSAPVGIVLQHFYVTQNDQAWNSGQTACAFGSLFHSYVNDVICQGATYGAVIGSTSNWAGYDRFDGLQGSGSAAGIFAQWMNSDTFESPMGSGIQYGTGMFIWAGGNSEIKWAHGEGEAVGLFTMSPYVNIIGGYYEAGYEASQAWAANTNYYVGHVVVVAGYEYICLQNGESGTSAPSWPTSGSQTFSDNTVVWQFVPSGGDIVFGYSSLHNCVFGGFSQTFRGVINNSIDDFPCEFMPDYGQVKAFKVGGMETAAGDVVSGGLTVAPTILGTFSAAGACSLPIALGRVCYHLVAGQTHTATQNWWMNLNLSTGAGGTNTATGLSQEATLSNAPNTEGVVESMTLTSGGTGYGASGTATLSCTNSGTAVTANWTATSGVVGSVSIANGGTGVAPQSCSDSNPPVHGTAFVVTVDSNYTILSPPGVQINAGGSFTLEPFGTWDIVGPSVDTTSVATAQTFLSNTASQSYPNMFMYLGGSTSPYTAPTSNTTANLSVGANGLLGNLVVYDGNGNGGVKIGSTGAFNGDYMTFNPDGNEYIDMLVGAAIFGAGTPKQSGQVCFWNFYNNATDQTLLGSFCSAGTGSGANAVTFDYFNATVESGDTIEVKSGGTLKCDSGSTCPAGSGTVTSSGYSSGSPLAAFSTATNITPATYSNVVALFSSCSGSQYLGYDGNCHTASGVTSFSGDGNFLTNSSSTGAVTATVKTAGANLWWGNNTGSTAASGYQALGVQDMSPGMYVAGGGTAQAQTATFSPALSSLVAGLNLYFLPTAANTAAAPTFSPNSLTAKTITKCGTAALIANDLTTTGLAHLIYDGTEWQLLNPAAGICGSSVAGGNLTAISTLESPTFESTFTNTDTSFRGAQNSSATSGLTIAFGYYSGGDESGATGANVSGSVLMRPGLVTSASGTPGVISIGQGFFKGAGTTTQWSLQSMTSTAFSVNDCATSGTSCICVASNATTPVMCIFHGLVPINATTAATVGDTVSVASATAGYVTDTGGTGCSTLTQCVGVVVAVSGNVIVGSGATKATVALSTTLPLVMLRFE